MMQKPKLWALADCNSFYCSCERIFRPDLQGKPVVVLSNNDGCLIALTPEAKALGFKMGDVFFQNEWKLKKHGVTYFSSNYTLYGDISRRVMAAILSVVPIIDQYSIDESFIPLDKVLATQPLDVGWALHERVQRWVCVPIRVGNGPTRTLAKLANHWAKKMSRVYMLELGPELDSILEQTPTADIWGIGRRISTKLETMGIRNAKQLRDMDANFARKILTVTGQRTVMELRGQQCIMGDTTPVPRKTLVNSRSFGRAVTNQEDLMQALVMHCTIAGERLREEKLEISSLSAYFQTSIHDRERPYRSISATVKLPIPTNITSELIKCAREALGRCFVPNQKWMKGGIMLYDIQELNKPRQMLLDEAINDNTNLKKRELMKAVDKVNDRFGGGVVHLSSEGQEDAFWRMKRNRMSGLVTTQIQDIPQVLMF